MAQVPGCNHEMRQSRHMHAVRRAILERVSLRMEATKFGFNAPTRRRLSTVILAGRPSASQRLLNASGSPPVWRLQTVQQPVRAAFQELRKSSEGCHGKWKIPVFNRSDRLHMDARQFGKTLLSQAGFEPGLTDVSPEHTQDVAVVHSP